ncbi:hypothetical protein [Yimella sp. cx-51]|uniref:hypothetical protein n=1 Tax=Yimella sp. cx-51 TaxID=2770551 RepID=UPI00165E8F0D|nr:hypothetical protein [Yimella sp. cx-51]MBC9956740.1 hypothetical protein [Yimella sp. cx-51]MBD2759169.1 hypothetical protein [Yimella sp. cx-573]QTH38976.1 hypothetical protein J5M86_04935 [Yimella sp. cx-51]
MLWLILALVVGVALASAVLGMVAVPARRQGRPLLTERGEKVVSSVSQTTDKVTVRAKGATDSVVSTVKRERSSTS